MNMDKSATVSNRPMVGVVRWDAWIGDLGSQNVGATGVGHQVERTLGPRQFHDRLPFYAQITGSDSVQAREITQEVMDQNIRYAADAGIDYWAMCWYADGSGMDTARKLYLASTLRDRIGYCFIFGAKTLREYFPRIVDEHFRNPCFQTVLGGRPLVYMFEDDYIDDELRGFRAVSQAAGLPNPYFVRMGYRPPDNLALSRKDSSSSVHSRSYAEVDAVSEYVVAATNGVPYSSLVASERKVWETVKDAGLKLIPTASTGWDARPRILNPVSWHKYPSDSWCQQATPAEIADHLREAIEWARANPESVEANSLMMYAWNEFDEGGWLCPTLLNGTDRIDAIREVLESYNAA